MTADQALRAGYVLLVDDVRSFRDGRPAEVARTAIKAIEILRARRGEHLSQLWLDHDLAGRHGTEITVMPVVGEIVAAAERGDPYDIGVVHVHTSNPSGSVAIRGALARVGVPVVRWHNLEVFVNHPTETAPDPLYPRAHGDVAGFGEHDHPTDSTRCS